MSQPESWMFEPLNRWIALFRVHGSPKLGVSADGVHVYCGRISNREDVQFVIPRLVGREFQPYLVKYVTEMTEGGKGWVLDEGGDQNIPITFPALLQKYGASDCNYVVSCLTFGNKLKIGLGGEERFLLSAAVCVPGLNYTWTVNIMVKEEDRDELALDLRRGWWRG
ncbi:hypothetical protein SCHPADRAFT_1001422 [Schizopora paradoxa]|uniref:Uncharacterized protein n=1 Tax=Schizopora paradoxa TaxID=27342 RepID=A0A0H2R7C9_9AGAM|nr:hypothetical protein SCHPADRAFT_1001422 [Schizopora paradoxa]